MAPGRNVGYSAVFYLEQSRHFGEMPILQNGYLLNGHFFEREVFRSSSSACRLLLLHSVSLLLVLVGIEIT